MSARRYLPLLLLAATTCLPLKLARAQNVGVGTNSPNQSALLELLSTQQGFLMTRVTYAQMLSIASPATGLFVFNTDQNTFYYYDGTAWIPFTWKNWSTTGNGGTTTTTNFLGTTDAQDVVQKTNNNARMRFYSTSGVGLISNSNVAEQLRFYEPSGSGSFYSGFKARAQSLDVHYRLPLSDGSQNSALVTDGSGNLSWKFFATIGGGGDDPMWQRGGGQRTLEGLGSGNKASGKYSIASGQNCSALGQYAMVFGSNNKGNGQEAMIAGGANNQASGNHASIAGGNTNTATGNHTTVDGGYNNTISGDRGIILGGSGNTISGVESAILGGTNNTTSGQDNLMFGSGIVTAGSNQILFKCPGPTETRLGLMVASPSQAVDANGNIKFSSSLKPNGSAGSSGQYLLSAGSGVSPTWGSATFPTNNWTLTGNSGTSPSTNFIGTTDATAFVVRTSKTERLRVRSTGEVSIGSTSGTSQLSSYRDGTTDETAGVYAASTGATTSQSIGIWGRVNNPSTSNTGSIAVLATGSATSGAGTTNTALQISSGEFAMGRTTQSPSKGTTTNGAALGTGYTDQGPSGVVSLSLQTDLFSVAPVAGIYQDLGTVTINNRYVTANSIILANVLNKINGGGSPDPKNAIYRADIESRAAGSFVLHLSMIPTLTDANTFQGSDYIYVGYIIINPGK